MILGTFEEDLNQFLAENKGRNGASKKSDVEIPKRGGSAKGILDRGKMYSFAYYTTEEAFYDRMPIVLGLGKSINDHQLAINLHYIPYEARVPFVTDVVKSFQNVIDSNLDTMIGKPNMQSTLNEFTYENIKASLGRKYNLTYAVRQYRLDRMRNPVVIGYEDWYLGVVNNENHFYGGNINEAQALYYKNI
jgi:hypothetical protein